MVLTLLALSLLSDIAPGPFEPKRRPPSPPPQCTQNSDCVLSTFQGCCPGCCMAPPHAVKKGTKEGEFCAAVDCERPNCSAVRCARPPDVSAYVALCRAGSCVAEPKTAMPPAQCQTAQDCKVVNASPPGDGCHQSPCGCCPVTQAVPVDAVVPLTPRPSEKQKKEGKPNYGLSTGGPPNPPQPPNCSPCPAPTGGTAACEAGRCVLVQPPVIRPRPPG